MAAPREDARPANSNGGETGGRSADEESLLDVWDYRQGRVKYAPTGYSRGLMRRKPLPPEHVAPFMELDEEKLGRVATKRLWVILNPYGGNGRGKKIWPSVRLMIEEAKIEFVVKETEHAGHAAEIVEQQDLDSFDALMVIGGDGLLQEIFTGFLRRADGKHLPVALVPGGTGNSVLYSMGFDANDWKACVNTFLKGYVAPMDLGKVTTEDGVFASCNMLGWGPYAGESNQKAEKLRMCGPIRYECAGLGAMIANECRRVRLEIDDRTVEAEFAFIFVGLSQYAGVHWRFCPAAKFNDGFFDVLLLRKTDRHRLYSMMQSLKDRGRHVFTPDLEYHRVRRLRIIDLDRPNSCLNVDGNSITTCPVLLEMLEGRVRVFVDPQKSFNRDRLCSPQSRS